MKDRRNPIAEDERQKRQAVFFMKPLVILVKFFGVNAPNGLPFKRRDDQEVDVRHREQARVMGLDPNAYRRKPDTGFQWCRTGNVRTPKLLEQLAAAGYRYVDGHQMFVEGKMRPVSVLVFSLEGEEKELPKEAVKWLNTMRFAQVTIWCNIRINGNGEKFRLDTINLNNPHTPSKNKREESQALSLHGHTYELNRYIS